MNKYFFISVEDHFCHKIHKLDCANSAWMFAVSSGNELFLFQTLWKMPWLHNSCCYQRCFTMSILPLYLPTVHTFKLIHQVPVSLFNFCSAWSDVFQKDAICEGELLYVLLFYFMLCYVGLWWFIKFDLRIKDNAKLLFWNNFKMKMYIYMADRIITDDQYYSQVLNRG